MVGTAQRQLYPTDYSEFWTYGFFFVLVLEMAARKMMMTMMETAISATMVCSLGFWFD